ncbi:MAG: cupredoxin domain-containing protein [Actinomycetota bacterium]|nr:cupredoxin domain-containing protein [Actinomycetota bacterium]
MRYLAVAVVIGFVVAMAAYGSARDRGQERIEIVINHSRFEPSSVTVDAGEEVTFVLVNRDPIAHEFIVGDRTIQHVHEKGTEAHHDEIPTEVSVPAGRTVTTTIEFAQAGPLVAADPLLFGCHLPNHYAFGMKGNIEIRT